MLQREGHEVTTAVDGAQAWSLLQEPAAPLLQRLLQLGDAGMDKLDAAVGRVGQRIEDFPVKNEGANHLPRVFQRVVKGGVIEVAQIAAKPDQGTGVFRHGAGGSL